MKWTSVPFLIDCLLTGDHFFSLLSHMDSFIFLFLENYGVRKLEALFAVLIATMGVSFAWMFGETKPSGKDLLMGKKVYLIGYLLFVL